MIRRRSRRVRSAGPVCPRCGYDLTGMPQSGTEAEAGGAGGGASDTVVCPECGLATPWADVLDPARHHLPWLYEHTPRRRMGLRRAWGTLLRALRPWRFWRVVTLSTAVSVPRLVLWLAVLIVPVHAAWGLVRFARPLVNLGTRGVPLGQIPAAEWAIMALDALGYPLVARRWAGAWTWGIHEPDATFLLPLGPTLLAPVILLLLSRSRATAKVRLGHILRAGVYGAGWIAGWYVLFAALTLAGAVTEWVTGARPAFGVSWLAVRVGWFSIAPLLVLLCLVWFGLWWWYAIVRCMKLPRGRLVWALVVTASLLLGVNLALLDRDFAFSLVRALWGAGL